MVGGLASEAERAAETEAIVKWAFGAFDTVTLLRRRRRGRPRPTSGSAPRRPVPLVAPARPADAGPARGARGLKARVVYDGPIEAPIATGPEARRARGRRSPATTTVALRPRRRRRRAARRADDPDQRRGAADPRPGGRATCPARLRGMAAGRASSASRASTARASRPRCARSPRRCAPAAPTVVETREPGGAPGAELIRRLLVEGDPGRWSPETEILLFTAARRDHLERTIRPALARGATVICDRFANSTRVYQGVARADLRGMVDALHALAIGVEPDLTLILDLDPDVALARGLARGGARGPLRALRRRLPGPAARRLPRARRRVPRPLPRRPRRAATPTAVAARVAAAVGAMSARPTSPTACPARRTRARPPCSSARRRPRRASSTPPPPAACTTPGCSPARAASARRRSPGASPAT